MALVAELFERCLERRTKAVETASEPLRDLLLAGFVTHVRCLQDGAKISCDAYARRGAEDGLGKDMYIYNNMNTSADTMLFYDGIENGFFFKQKIAIANVIPENVKTLWCSVPSHRARMVLSFLVSAVIYYADVVKDIFIAVQFKEKVVGTITDETWKTNPYPVSMFIAFVTSLVLTETKNMVTVFRDPFLSQMGWGARLLATAMSPLMPGAAIYAERRRNLRIRELHHKIHADSDTLSDEEVKALMEARSAMHAAQNVRAKLRANENVLEHLVQLTLLVTILLAEMSSTRSVQTVGSIVVNVDVTYYAVGAALLAVVSLIKGHIAVIDAKKKGHLPFKGKYIILPAYFGLSILSRVYAILIFLTPALGL